MSIGSCWKVYDGSAITICWTTKNRVMAHSMIGRTIFVVELTGQRKRMDVVDVQNVGQQCTENDDKSIPTQTQIFSTFISPGTHIIVFCNSALVLQFLQMQITNYKYMANELIDCCNIVLPSMRKPPILSMCRALYPTVVYGLCWESHFSKPVWIHLSIPSILKVI